MPSKWGRIHFSASYGFILNTENDTTDMQRESETSPDVMGTREAAQTLGVSVRTVQLWVEKGKLRAWKTVGGHRRILRDSVADALDVRQEEVTPAVSVHSRRVLIVEDDTVMQTYYDALFNILGFDGDIRFAKDGFEGLVELGKTAPDLMLVDIDLPNMNGITMLERIREHDLATDTRVAIVTALDGGELEARGGLPEDTPVYSKPLSVEDLQALLDNAQIVYDGVTK